MTRVSKGLSIPLIKPVIPYYVISDDPTDPVGSEVSVLISIDSSAATEDLTDFPFKIDMSKFDDDFWSVIESGDNLKFYAYNNSNSERIPIDVSYLSKEDKAGDAFVKTNISSTSNTEILITYNSEYDEVAVDSDYGRNAVWSDFEVVFQFPEKVNRTGKYTASYSDAGSNDWIKNSGTFIDADDHLQGVTSDDSAYDFVTETEIIYKYNYGDHSSPVLTNSTFIADFQALTGSDCDHICDPCYVNGEIVVPVNNYPALSPSQEYMVFIDPDDLSILRYYDIAGQASGQCSSFTYNTDDGNFWACNYETGDSVFVFDSTGVLVSEISLSTTKRYAQSISYYDGDLLISAGQSSENSIYRFDTSGNFIDTFYYAISAGDSRVNERTEGFHISENRILRASTLNLLTTMTKNERYKNWSRTEGEGLREVEIGSGNTSSVFTAVASFKMTYPYQQSVLTYGQANLAIDNGDELGIWNSSDSWLYPSDNSIETFNEYRLGYYHNGTSGRGIYSQGSKVASESSSSSRPLSSDPSFYVGYSSENSNESSSAYTQGVWLRNEIMTDSWMLFDFLNNSDSDSYYTCQTLSE
jgi:hypothetical protein